MVSATSASLQIERPQWRSANWEDYVRSRDQGNQQHRLFFHAGYLWVKDRGWEGINHAQVKDLFILLLGLWYIAHPEPIARSFRAV